MNIGVRFWPQNQAPKMQSDSRVRKSWAHSKNSINVRRAWRTIARGAAKPWEPSGTAVCETSVAYLRKQSKLALFFDRRQKFCRQTAPVLGSRNGPQNGGQVVRTQANQIETELPPFWGPFRPQNPSAKSFPCSGFQGRQSGPPQFKNMCGHKRSQGVENNCSRRCKTMGTQWHSGMRNFCRVPAETIETCTIFRPAAKNLPTNGPRLGVQKRTPKRGPSRPDTSKSN